MVLVFLGNESFTFDECLGNRRKDSCFENVKLFEKGSGERRRLMESFTAGGSDNYKIWN